MTYKSNEEIKKELIEKFSVVLQPEWIASNIPTKYLVDEIISQRLQDLQAIKEMVEKMKGYSSPDCSDPFLVEQGYEVALQNVQLKLDELMK